MLTIFNKHRVVIYTSAGVSFVIFIGIIFYHAQRQLLLTRFGTKMKKSLFNYLSGQKDKEDGDTQLHACMHNINDHDTPKEVTHTVVELNQPLLENETN